MYDSFTCIQYFFYACKMKFGTGGDRLSGWEDNRHVDPLLLHRNPVRLLERIGLPLLLFALFIFSSVLLAIFTLVKSACKTAT